MNSCVIICGNSAHPDGAWHLAEPIPPTWKYRARLRYWLNRRRWGCGCNRRSSSR